MRRLPLATGLLLTLLGQPLSAYVFLPTFESTSLLHNGRFEVTVEWQDYQGNEGIGYEAWPAYYPGHDNAPFLTTKSMALDFFSDDNIELIVKVLPGCYLNGHRWVFSAGATNVEYSLHVLDKSTGNHFVHHNPMGQRSPALTATTALPCEPRPNSEPVQQPDPEFVHSFIGLGERIWVEWRDFEGQEGYASLSRIEIGGDPPELQMSDLSRLFWFFQWGNFELITKIIDGCAVNGNYWFLSAALTDVEYHITVRDRATNEVRRYDNALGTAALPVIDLGAFGDCDVEWTGERNLPPVAEPDLASTVVGRGLELEVLQNDWDPEGDELRITEVKQPFDLAVSVAPDGRSLSFPAPSALGKHRFSYLISDGEVTSAALAEVLVLKAENRPPEANDDTFEVLESEDGWSASLYPLENDWDPDGEEILIYGVSSSEGVEARASFRSISVTSTSPGTVELKYWISDDKDMSSASVFITFR